IDRASLSRSKGSRCPCFLITVNSRSCTRSKVVKRAAQFGQNRRRRIAPRSSVGRESLTWVSSLPQNGQRISSSHPARAPGRFLRIDREAGAKLPDLVAHPRLDPAILTRPARQSAQYVDDQPPDDAEF